MDEILKGGTFQKIDDTRRVFGVFPNEGFTLFFVVV